MKKTKLLATIAIAILTYATQAQQGASVAEQYLLQLANQHRAEHGFGPLAWDPALAHAAHNHALRIMKDGGPALHQYSGEPDTKTRAVQAGAHFSVVSENVAGDGTTAVEIERAWMNSPVHRANILDPKLTAVGISVVQNHGILYAVEDFSRASTVLSDNQIEQQALKALRSHGIPLAAAAEAQNAARESCRNPNSAAGSPILSMQWDGPDLNELPDALIKQMPNIRQHTVAVGSCPSDRQNEGFTTYHVAVLVFQ